ncbi:vWA domain-containing protein [Actinopolymorpha alba]|uniref:vWA domain-containing protein n=1 Tax=Actinopolymorpha alba TaxID=533267 RepID=UPI00035E6FD0|nr:VWA domain-containing protein [Actinopolymorpha alba]
MSTWPPRLLAVCGSFAVLTGLVAGGSVASASAAPAAASPATALTPVSAAPPPQAQAARTNEGDASHKLLLLFDSSGSMKDLDDDGTTKIEAARGAFRRLIPRLPAAGEVGLRVYGATIYDRNAPGACRDTQLAVPIGPADKDALTRAVEGFRPYGETPISYSLQQAAKDLGTTGKRTILLVSDGEETCDPNPCATARQIAGLGINLKIDVVGFRINREARDQLRCIADAGSGTFYETSDAETLAASLHRLSVRAFRPFRVSGRAVSGAPEPEAGPTLTAGQYVDSAPRREETKFYRVRRTIKASTLHIGASARPAPGNAVSSIRLETKTSQGGSCGYGLGTEVSYTRTNPVVTAATSSWDQFTSYQSACQDATELVVALSQSNRPGAVDAAEDTLGGVPVEIVVIEEPPVTSKDGLPPEADGRPTWTNLPAGNTTEITAGASFSDAPLVDAGRYTSSLFPGEVQFFKVRLQWGQRLEAAVRAPKPSPKLAALTDNPQVLDIRMISPVRGKAQAALSNVAGKNQTFLDDHADAEARTMAVEVRYVNRDAGSESQKSVALPGDYFVAISLAADRDDESYLLPVEVAIGVEGTAGMGAPRYAGGDSILVPGPDGGPTRFQAVTASGPAAAAEPQPDSGPGNDGSSTNGPASGQSDTALPFLASISRPRLIAVAVLSGIVVILTVVSIGRAVRRRRPRQQGTSDTGH